MPHLSKVAELMVERGIKKPTTGMRAYLVTSGPLFKETDETLIRRWQVKWKTFGEELLVAAHENKLAESARRKSSETSAALSQFAVKLVRDRLNPTLLQQINSVLLPTVTRMNEWQSALKVMHDMSENSQLMKAFEAARAAMSEIEAIQRSANSPLISDFQRLKD
ncbi:hypothetical protein BV900_27875 [Agrobacterium tumefaciens]|nr:hypothetical protein BV900_27875 [Agrobacterium tumefaciens]